MSQEEPVKKKHVEEDEEETDIKELEIVKGMISEWIDKAGAVVKDIVSAAINSLDGRKLSEEIVEMYKRLKESGLQEETVNEIIRDFYKRKLELFPSLRDLASTISEMIRSKKVKAVTKEKEVSEKEED